MININLLPIDQKKQAPGRQPTGPLFLTFLLVFLTMTVIYGYLVWQTKDLVSQIHDLDQEISKKEKLTKEYDQLKTDLAKSQILVKEFEELDEKSRLVPLTFEELKSATPEGIQFTSLSLTKATDKNIRISASANSLRLSALYLERFNTLPWVAGVIFPGVTIDDENKAQFTLEVTAKDLQ